MCGKSRFWNIANPMAARSPTRIGWRSSSARATAIPWNSTGISAISPVPRCPRGMSPKASNGSWHFMTSACVTRRARPALGTFVEIAATGASPFDRDRAIAAGFAAVARVHALMSFHEGGSDLSRLNRAPAGCDVAVDPWTWHVLAAAHELHQVSGGVFDVAIAPALQAAGLLPAIDGCCGEETVSAGRDAAFVLPAPGRVRIMRRGAALDLGGIAKGFAVDRAVDAMKCHGGAA